MIKKVSFNEISLTNKLPTHKFSRRARIRRMPRSLMSSVLTLLAFVFVVVISEIPAGK